MADTKTSALPAAGSALLADEIPVNEAGTSKKVSLTQVRAAFLPVDLSGAEATGVLAAARHPALTGDVTNSAGALATTIANNAVTNAKAAQMATLTIKGNNTGGTANAADLTVAQVNAILPVVTAALNGLAPLSGGGTTNFLRADGSWAAPPGGGGLTASGPPSNGQVASWSSATNLTGAAQVTTAQGGFGTSMAAVTGFTKWTAGSPSTGALASGDLPTHTHPGTDINNGAGSSQVQLSAGGTAADLSATGPGTLVQTSAGAAVTVSADPNHSFATHSTTTTVATATDVALAFDTNVEDVGGIHSTSTNNTRFTCPTNGDGWYLATGLARFPTVFSGTYRSIFVRKNGSTQVTLQQTPPISASTTYLTVSGCVHLAATDYIEFVVNQDSGSNISVGTGSTQTFGQLTKLR